MVKLVGVISWPVFNSFRSSPICCSVSGLSMAADRVVLVFAHAWALRGACRLSAACDKRSQLQYCVPKGRRDIVAIFRGHIFKKTATDGLMSDVETRFL